MKFSIDQINNIYDDFLIVYYGMDTTKQKIDEGLFTPLYDAEMHIYRVIMEID